ncbi:hypothetical protein ABEW05_005484 [Botrytis cinerea]
MGKTSALLLDVPQPPGHRYVSLHIQSVTFSILLSETLKGYQFSAPEKMM